MHSPQLVTAMTFNVSINTVLFLTLFLGEILLLYLLLSGLLYGLFKLMRSDSRP